MTFKHLTPALLAIASTAALAGCTTGPPDPPDLVIDPPVMTDVPVPEGRKVPTGMEASAVTRDFAVHYDPARTSSAYAAKVAVAAQYSFIHLVKPATSEEQVVLALAGEPNAGLRAPIRDEDGLVDVYLTAPEDRPEFRGGKLGADASPPYAGFVYLTPDQSRDGAEFRVAHEFMHVVDRSYQPLLPAAYGGFYTEASANWAAGWGLRGRQTPLDSSFSWPSDPLDCVASCPSGGYGQWLFVERQVQQYGADFVHGILERQRNCAPGCDGWARTARAYFDDEIRSQSAGTASLATRFESYARDVWDPSRWTGNFDSYGYRAVSDISLEEGRPLADTWDRGNLGDGPVVRSHTVDRLATRYVLIQNRGDHAGAAPGDQLEITVERPSGVGTAWRYMTHATPGSPWQDHDGARTLRIPFDPAQTGEVLLPLTNDSAVDGKTFTYSLRLVRAAPTPPANDARGGAAAAEVGTQSSADTAYAGGTGAAEAPSCPGAAGAANGVWYRVAVPSRGTYEFDATPSDFPAVVSVYSEDGSFGGCAGRGSFATVLDGPETLLVYVGRRASAPGDGSSIRTFPTGGGSVARLRVGSGS